MKRSLAGTLLGLVILPAYSFADVPGSFGGREISDAVFRRMDNAPELHGAIYIGQTNKAGKPPTEPLFHEVIEMTGILDHGLEVYIEIEPDSIGGMEGMIGPKKLDLRVKEGGVGLIGFSNFDSFQRSHPAYYGSFMHPSYPGMEIRKDILRKAQELKNRDIAIEYIVMPRESASKLLYKYFEYREDAGAVLTDNDIVRMRSDAFVEYCYAWAGRPIMDDNITLRAGADALESKWFPLPVYPSDQRDNLPLSVNAGFTVAVLPGMGLSLDVKRLVYDRQTVFSAGTEYAMLMGNNLGFALRGGYGLTGLTRDNGDSGLSVGAGVMALGAQLDYAVSPETGMGSVQRITLKKKF